MMGLASAVSSCRPAPCRNRRLARRGVVGGVVGDRRDARLAGGEGGDVVAGDVLERVGVVAGGGIGVAENDGLALLDRAVSVCQGQGLSLEIEICERCRDGLPASGERDGAEVQAASGVVVQVLVEDEGDGRARTIHRHALHLRRGGVGCHRHRRRAGERLGIAGVVGEAHLDLDGLAQVGVDQGVGARILAGDVLLVRAVHPDPLVRVGGQLVSPSASVMPVVTAVSVWPTCAVPVMVGAPIAAVLVVPGAVSLTATAVPAVRETPEDAQLLPWGVWWWRRRGRGRCCRPPG